MSSDDEVVFKKKFSKKGSSSAAAGKVKENMLYFADEPAQEKFLGGSIGASKQNIALVDDFERAHQKNHQLTENDDAQSNFVPISRDSGLADDDDEVAFKKPVLGMNKYGVNVAFELPSELAEQATTHVADVNALLTQGIIPDKEEVITVDLRDSDDEEQTVEKVVTVYEIEDEDHGMFARAHTLDSFLPISQASAVMQAPAIDQAACQERPRRAGKTDFSVDTLISEMRSLQIQEKELSVRCKDVVTDLEALRQAQTSDKEQLIQSEADLDLLRTEDLYFNGLTSCFIVKNAMLQSYIDKYIAISSQLFVIRNDAFTTDQNRIVDQCIGVVQDAYGRNSSLLGGMQGLESASLRKQMKLKASWPRRGRNVYVTPVLVDGEETEEEDAALDVDAISQVERLGRERDAVLQSVNALYSDVTPEYATQEAILPRVLGGDLTILEQAAVLGVLVLQRVVLEDPLIGIVFETLPEEVRVGIVDLFLGPFAVRYFPTQIPRRLDHFSITREVEDSNSQQSKKRTYAMSTFIRGADQAVHTEGGWRGVWDEYSGMDTFRNRENAWFGEWQFRVTRNHAEAANALKQQVISALKALAVPTYVPMNMRSVKLGYYQTLRIFKLFRMLKHFHLELSDEQALCHVQSVLAFVRQIVPFVEKCETFAVVTTTDDKVQISLGFFFTVILSSIVATLHEACIGTPALSRVEACSKQCARALSMVCHTGICACLLDSLLDVSDNTAVFKSAHLPGQLEGHIGGFELGRKALLFCMQLQSQ